MLSWPSGLIATEHAANGPCVVLLDEVETLAADRQRLSLEANPIDVHRATDAALAGIDLLARRARNVLLLATTNFRAAVDRALLSRADWIEEIARARSAVGDRHPAGAAELLNPISAALWKP